MCISPLEGYRAREKTVHGKRAVVFSVRDGFADLPVSVPCGQCVECRLRKKREWALRCVQEASLHEENCYLTLTYSNFFLPRHGSLDRTAFPRFMKRLRKAYAGKRIRYFSSGEYGRENGRPHYHALLFGIDFADKKMVGQRKGYPVYESETVRRFWPYGFSELGDVSLESAAYVAKYVMKRGSNAETDIACVDYDTGEVVERAQEYVTMSRNPGIGMPWLAKYLAEVYDNDSVVQRGVEVKPPRAYDAVAVEWFPEVMQRIKNRRKDEINIEEQRGMRLLARKEVAEALCKLKSGV